MSLTVAKPSASVCAVGCSASATTGTVEATLLIQATVGFTCSICAEVRSPALENTQLLYVMPSALFSRLSLMVVSTLEVRLPFTTRRFAT